MASYCFGDFVLDPTSRVLLCNQQPVFITAKVFETLVLLVENRGRVMTKEELLSTLWPKTTVEEANLTQSISALRKALGDNPKEHRYIATVPGRGYSFVAAVTESVGNEDSPEQLSPEPTTTKAVTMSRSPREKRFTLIGIFILSLIAIAAYFFFRPVTKSQQYYSSVPLTGFVGSEVCPSFAPDGERVAFAWDGEKQDNFDIYVKQIGDSTLLRLTTDRRPDLSPTWSPDGRMIAFLRLISDEKAEVLLISSVAAGPARTLAEVIAPLTVFTNLKFIAWSPDGKWIAVSDGPSFGGVMGLFLLSVETGEKRRLTLPTVEHDDYEPSFSPDMRYIAFVRYQGGSVQSDLFVLDLSADLRPQDSPRRVTFYNRHIASPVWTSDGRAIVFTRSEAVGNHSVWRISVAGEGRSEPVLLSTDSSLSLDISRRGDRLVYTRERLSKEVWAVDLASAKERSQEGGAPVQWIIGSILDADQPQFSPDGQKIVFQSDRTGGNEIWICDRDGSHVRQLTHMGAFVIGFPHWSPDGKKIVFHSRPKGSAVLYLISVEGGPPKGMGAEEEGNDTAPSWSHDGKWIYFASRRTGDIQVWKTPAGGGPRIQVTKNGGWAPLESIDGKYLFYIKLPHYALWRLPLMGGNESEVLPNVASFGTAYAAGQEGIYFIRNVDQGAGQELSFYRFANGQTTLIVRIPHSVGLGLALSPDERQVLYTQTNQDGSDLMLIENFH